MKINWRFVVFMTAVVLLACSDNAKRTPDKNFYFEIKTFQQNDFSMMLATLIESRVPLKKYVITNRSGLEWPYYAELELDEDIPLDSLMPPHAFAHRMIFMDSNSVLKPGDYLVRFELMPHLDTIPNYRVEVYEMDSSELTISGTSGIHYVDATAFPSNLSLVEHCLKSVIRYSFK